MRSPSLRRSATSPRRPSARSKLLWTGTEFRRRSPTGIDPGAGGSSPSAVRPAPAPPSWRSRSPTHFAAKEGVPPLSMPTKWSRRSRNVSACRSSPTCGAPSSPSNTGWATWTRRSFALDVMSGLPNVGAWSQVRPSEVLDVIEAVGRTRRHVIANIASRLEDVGRGGRGRYGISRAVVCDASDVVGVAPATPVGVTRLLGWVTDVRALNAGATIHLAINRAPRDAFRKAELEQEIRRTFEPASLVFLPHDPRVDTAAWSGRLVAYGPYAKAVAELATRLAPPSPSARRRRGGSGRRRGRVPVVAR